MQCWYSGREEQRININIQNSKTAKVSQETTMKFINVLLVGATKVCDIGF